MKILSREKYHVLCGLVELTRIKQKELQEIERIALEITEEKDSRGLPDFGHYTADLLDENISLDEALGKMGFELEKSRKFPKKKFKEKNKENIIPKKIIVPEENDRLDQILG